MPAWIRLLGFGVWTAAFVLALLRPPAPPVSRHQSGHESTLDSLVLLDPFRTSTHTVAVLHQSHGKVMCVLRAGVWEPDQPDAARFPAPLRGSLAPVGGRWLDVRAWDQLAEPLTDRLALCAAKGFDGVYLVDLDGWAQPTGFPLSRTDQLEFNTAVVGAAHSQGLSVAVRPTPETPMPDLG